MIEKSKIYIRTSPQGDKSTIAIVTDEEVAYHSDLEKSGFKYIEHTNTEKASE